MTDRYVLIGCSLDYIECMFEDVIKEYDAKYYSSELDAAVFKSSILRLIYRVHTRFSFIPFQGTWNRYLYDVDSYPENTRLIFVLLGNAGQKMLRARFTDYVKSQFPGSIFVRYSLDVDNLMGWGIDNAKKEMDYNFVYDPVTAEKWEISFWPIPCSKLEEPKTNPEYDVYFCGSDKGRAEAIKKIARNLATRNIKSLFMIQGVDDSEKENVPGIVYIDEPISYRDHIKNVINSKCLIDLKTTTNTRKYEIGGGYSPCGRSCVLQQKAFDKL